MNIPGSQTASSRTWRLSINQAATGVLRERNGLELASMLRNGKTEGGKSRRWDGMATGSREVG